MIRLFGHVAAVIVAYMLAAIVLAMLVRPDLAGFVLVVLILASALHAWLILERASTR